MDNLDLFPIPDPTVVSRQLENEAVLVLPARGQVKVLNEVGARIWALVNGKRSVRQIAEALCSEYEVDLSIVLVDTQRFLDDLAERGVLTFKPDPKDA